MGAQARKRLPQEVLARARHLARTLARPEGAPAEPPRPPQRPQAKPGLSPDRKQKLISALRRLHPMD